MKKGSIIALCIGSGLFLIGVVLCLVLMAFGMSPGVMLNNGDLTIDINGLNVGIYNGNLTETEEIGDPAETGIVYQIRENIDTLDINWISGEVIVQPSEDGKLSFYEEWEGAISKSDALSYDVNGAKLSIEWDEKTVVSLWDIHSVSKRLVVSIPEELKSVYINSVSAEVYWRDVSVSGKLEVNTVSGDISVENADAKYVLLDSTSGEQNFYGNCVSVEMNTVSGDCRFAGKCAELGFSSGSGDFVGEFSELPDEMEIDTVSGDSELIMPSELDFELEFDTVSGELYCDLPLIYGDGEYRCGNGKCEISFNSTSGDIKIK